MPNDRRISSGLKTPEGDPHNCESPRVKGGFDERSYPLRLKFWGASNSINPVHGRRLRSHLRASGSAVGNRLLNGNVEAAGKSHSAHIWDKSIRFRQADGRKLAMYLENQRLGRYSF